MKRKEVTVEVDEPGHSRHTQSSKAVVGCTFLTLPVVRIKLTQRLSPVTDIASKITGGTVSVVLQDIRYRVCCGVKILVIQLVVIGAGDARENANLA